MFKRKIGSVFVSFGLTVVLTAMLSGCAGIGGPSPEEGVQAAVDSFHAGIVAGDVEAAMAMISENFSNSQGADRSQMQVLLGQAASQGFFADMKVDLENAVTAIDGDTATISPVIYNTAVGALTLSYELKKEEGGWMFTSTEISQ